MHKEFESATFSTRTKVRTKNNNEKLTWKARISLTNVDAVGGRDRGGGSSSGKGFFFEKGQKRRIFDECKKKTFRTEFQSPVFQ